MKIVEYYHKNSDVVAFERLINTVGFWFERTYDGKGKELTYKNSDGYWREKTYDGKGKELTHKDSDGYWREKTYNENGNQLTFKDSNGYFSESTWDENGNQLTYKNSDDNFEIRGKRVTKPEFKEFISNLNKPHEGKKVIVDGVEYELR